MSVKVNYHLDVVEPDGDKKRIDFGAASTVLVSNGPTILPTFQTLTAVGGGAPSDAQFLTLATDADLSEERVFTPTSGHLVGTDNGTGAAYDLSLATTAVTAGSYVSVDLTVDDYGRITSISNGGTANNTAYIQASRTFPSSGDEGQTTIGGLGATHMEITIWGCGGGGAASSTGTQDSGGGSGSAIVGWKIDIVQLTALSATTFTVTIGAGGAGGTSGGDGANGAVCSCISQDSDNVVSLTAYGGGGGEADDGIGGGGGGTGGSAAKSVGGAANGYGGAAGPNGSFSNTAGSIDGVFHTGWGGGGTAQTFQVGSDWPNRSKGGALNTTSKTSGGAGGYNGNGGDAGIEAGGNGVSAAANSGAGGGAATGGNGNDGGVGGSGGCIIRWW